MATYQRIFSDRYSEELKRSVLKLESLDKYNCDGCPFEVDNNNSIIMTRIEHPDGLNKELVKYTNATAGDDFQAAKLLFEAYGKIPLLLASHAPFWECLSHIDLYDYMRLRWPKATIEDQTSKEQLKKYIIDHWFYSGQNGQWLAGLWWSVKLTYRETRDDPYELTRVLFKNQDWRGRTGGPSTVFRHQPAADAIIEFVQKHEKDVFRGDFNGKSRYMMKYLNRVGGSKELMYMDKQFFVDLLERKAHDIEHNYDEKSRKSGRIFPFSLRKG